MDPRFFLPCFHGPRASRLGHKRKEKNSVHNLPYGPRTRLIRGIYGVFGAETVNEILTVLHVLHNILQTCSCSFKNFNKIFCFALFVVLQLRKKIIKKINDA